MFMLIEGISEELTAHDFIFNPGESLSATRIRRREGHGGGE
jgi:hypothetical protein